MKPGPPQDIFEAAHEAFISMDAEGAVVYWNARAEELFGYSRDEAIGMAVADALIPAAQREAHRDALRRFLQ
ncbi:MAG: two-component system, sensor histidine kinase and response regulator, partial [Solirubrobacteraceae bacterium]|nr:two-component system, sensor histidine kinase and response regulator [Solirubrobacteraceae bacterium]